MNKPRVVRRVAILSGLLLVAWLAPLLLLPMVVDSEAVKAKARAFIAEKTNVASARIEKIEIFWFPRPGFVIQNAAISIDKEIQGMVRQLRLYPSMRQALSGNLAFSSMSADGAQWRVRLPARSEEPFNLDQVEEKIRSAVNGLASAFPGMKLRIRGSTADIGIAGRPSLIIKEIDATFDVSLGKVAFTISAGANFADSIRFTGEIAPSSLATEARLSVGNLGLRKVLEVFSPDSVGWLEDGAVTLNAQLSGAGLKTFRAEIAGSLPSLTLARGARKAPIATKDFKVNIAGDEKKLRVAIEDLPLVSPPLKAAGEIIFDRPSSWLTVKLTARDLDAGGLRKSALLLADDVTSVQNVFRYLQGGTIPEIHVETHGRSFAEALTSKQAVVTANLRSVKIFLPERDLGLENVAGSLLISAGVLECKSCSATLGKAKAREGSLRMGLDGAGAPFHLDIMVESDARELQSLLIRHSKDEAFRKGISRFHDVDGVLSGRLVLGETLDAMSAQVLAVQPALTVRHEAVPYPVSLKGGRFNYADGKIETEGLEGAIGRSSFSGLTGTVRAEPSGQLDIKSASLQLDLQETAVLLRKVEALQAMFGPESAARGKIDFAAISLRGPLNDPGRWDFTGRGKVDGLWLKHRLLPAPVAINQGSFDAAPGKITFAKTKVQMLDASFSGGGVVNDWLKRPSSVDAEGSGIAGQRMMDWLRRQSEIPRDFMPRSPLELSASRMTWRDDRNFSFNGKLTVAHGPRLAVDLARTGRSLAVKELSIDDAGQSARATFDLQGDRWGIVFRGNLIQQTLDKIFVSAPVRIGLLQGNFSVNGTKKAPFGLSALGTLAGKDIGLRITGATPVVEQIVIQADQAGINIRSAALRWRGSQFSASGKLTAPQDVLQVDMDVSADRLVWEEFSDIAGVGNDQKAQDRGQITLPAVNGAIRLKASHFTVGSLSWNPLQVTAQLTANGINSEVEKGSVVCGIGTVGRLSVRENNQIEVDVRLSARDGELDSTTRCLSSGKSEISGTYSLDARLTGRASGARLAQSLSGEIDFASRDGKFIRAEGVDATFDYLNDSGDFNVAFPDLNKAAMPYSLISGKGTVTGQSIFASELIIEASPYAITGQGTADFERKSIEGKGLVTVLLPADQLLKKIPLLGSILSGSIIGIPISVNGSLERPEVSYLSPAALGAVLVNMPLRILKLPLGMLQMFTPSQPGLEK